jgi:mRNA-degrading endonuclease RelE of RelBE toxin-antitoxin system
LAWTVEYDEGAIKDLKQLDRQAQREILDYMDQRVGKAEDPRAFGQAAAAQQIRPVALPLARLSNHLPTAK